VTRSRRILWARHVALAQEEKLEGKGTLRRHRHMLEDNIKVNLKEMERWHEVEYSGSG